MTSTTNRNGLETGKVNGANRIPVRSSRRAVCARSHVALEVNGGAREPLICREHVQHAVEPIPIWLAALIATRCQATSNGEDHTVSWNCIAGRAVYTNAGVDTELIQPLGVRLLGGQTLSVTWLPGETEYTVEVLRSHEMYA